MRAKKLKCEQTRPIAISRVLREQQRTDQPTDGPTDPLIEMRGRKHTDGLFNSEVSVFRGQDHKRKQKEYQTIFEWLFRPDYHLSLANTGF